MSHVIPRRFTLLPELHDVFTQPSNVTQRHLDAPTYPEPLHRRNT